MAIRLFRRARPAAALLTMALCASGAASSDERPFDDDSLQRSPLSVESFVQAVLARNASLAAMRQAVLAAGDEIRSAGALEDPTLTTSIAPRTIGAGGGLGGEIQLMQPLPWWGTRAARTQVAQAQAEATDQDARSLQVRLVMLARTAFSDWVYVQHATAIADSNLSVLSDLSRLARVRYASGQAAQADVLQADVNRTLIKEQQLRWQAQRDAALAHMNALLGRGPHEALAEPVDLPENIAVPPEQLLAQRLVGHPRLQQLQAEEEGAQARERLQEKERYPTFVVGAGYNSMWSDPAQRPMIALTVTLPLNQDKYRSQIDAARAQVRRSAYELTQEKASMLAELASDYASVRQSVQSLSLYREELLPLAHASFEAARADYASGRGEFQAVLTAEVHQLDAQLELARLTSEYYQRLAQLEQDCGGGLLDGLPGVAGQEGATP